MARDISGSDNGTVGTGVVTALPENGDRVLLFIQADSTNAGIIYFKGDGQDPSATDYHVELTAGAGIVLDSPAPAGPVKFVGSAAGQRYSVWEA